MKLLIEHWRVASLLTFLLIVFLAVNFWLKPIGFNQLLSSKAVGETIVLNSEDIEETNTELIYRLKQRDELMVLLKEYELKVLSYDEINNEYTLKQLQVHKQYLEEKINKLETLISALNESSLPRH